MKALPVPLVARGRRERVVVCLLKCWTSSCPARNGADLRLNVLESAVLGDGTGQAVRIDYFGMGVSYGRASELAARWAWIWRPTFPQNRSIRERAELSDVVVLHRLAALWAAAPSQLKRCVVDVDDIPSQICRQGLGRGAWWIQPVKYVRYRLVRWAERLTLGRLGAVLVCSEDDASYLNLPNVHVVPNAFPGLSSGNGADINVAPSDLLFVGELAYLPNEQGLRWFIEQVLPRIRQQRPGTTLRVVGRVPPQIPEDWTWRFADGVEFLGPVDAIPPYLAATSLSICPLHEGRGTRIKILEALALQRSVVSTTVGAYGLPMQDEAGLFRADDPETFARICCDLLDDPDRRQRSAVAGQRQVEAQFSPDAVALRLQQVITRVAECSRASGKRTVPTNDFPGSAHAGR